MRAMLSSGWTPSYGQRTVNGRGGPRTAPEAAAAAIREAELILSETEAGKGDMAFYLPLSSRGNILVGRPYTGPAGYQHEQLITYPVGTSELASSLAAILPVLDELAEDAASRAYDDTVYGTSHVFTPDADDDIIGRSAWLHIDIFDRNRATNAALEAQAGR